MKKVLLASTALVMSAGFAAADVSVGGDGRMGVVAVDGGDLNFTSRIRISFSASGETDAGLAFGGSIRADNSGAGAGPTIGGQTAGNVFVEGSFGKISMGDVSGAPEAAVGDLSGVGLTGLGDHNEFVYLSNANRSAARWDYTTGDLGLHVSHDNPGTATVAPADTAYGLAVTYGVGDISFGLGYEDNGTTGHIIGGVTAGFGDATVKVIYGDADDLDFSQAGISLDFVSGATTFTAFYRTAELAGVDADTYGVGVAYDLGGGASIKAGYADGDDINPFTTGTFGAARAGESYDLGISMSF